MIAILILAALAIFLAAGLLVVVLFAVLDRLQ